MTTPPQRRLPSWIGVFLALIVGLGVAPGLARAAGPAAQAETARAALARAQTALPRDVAGATKLVADARAAYSDDLASRIATAAPEADRRIRDGLALAEVAATAADVPGLAAARSQVWTALLAGSLGVVEHALEDNDGQSAQAWLPLREFRRATRFSRPNADATLAVEAVVDGKQSGPEALAAVRADLLDTYQARLTASMADLTAADAQGLVARRAELSSLVAGYMTILAPAYAEQRSPDALTTLTRQIGVLQQAARAGQGVPVALASVERSLRSFRAAPLSSVEQARRAGQLLRFLALVPVEYGRGVSNGTVTHDLEIREAATFRDGAAAAFADLQPTLTERDAAATSTVAALLQQLGQQIASTSTGRSVADPGAIQDAATQAAGLLRQTMPVEWQRASAAGDFDVIDTVLDQMETAVASGQYELAESARLEAYAVLESGPEVRLVVFAPEYKLSLEGLFWYGHGEKKGLAALLAERAPAATVKAARRALDTELTAAQKALGGSSDPASAATNAGVIVFREGLEAVLILASLMAGLRGAQRVLRRPLWGGVVAALVATALTWVVANGVIGAFARFGEKLEAVVSLIAIAVLLLITNWFFHDAYWVGWMASFHGQKRRLLGLSSGQWLGLAALGFTSVYREGFETVLFLQALVLEAGLHTVLIGTAVGLAATLAVGVLVFALQSKLPAKRLLIVTGVMIGAVLLVMVGNTVQTLQVVGWLPITPIRGVSFPAWAGLWLGLYPTWEGIGLQVAAAAFVIGSYVVAERLRRRRHQLDVAQPVGERVSAV